MDTIIASIALGASIAGALITFGITYGILKSRQEFTKSEISELKQDVREMRHEFEEFRRTCAAIYRIPSRRNAITDSSGDFPTIED